MKNPNDPRHQSRIIAVQRLFNLHFKKDGVKNHLDLSAEEMPKINEFQENRASIELVEEIVSGVEKNLTELDKTIQKFANERPIDQIARVDKEILRVAIFEGFHSQITPPRVAIDEAIEIARIFSNESSAKFISGVLGNLFKSTEKK